MKKNRVVLIGYRACGKSTVGRLLAKKTGFDFLDTDCEIEQQEGRSINEMVAASGWSFFRKKEKELLRRLTERERVIIATGGGAVLHREIWPEILNSSFCVWLKASPDVIRQRLQKDRKTHKQRPSLTGNNVLNEVQEVLKEREPLYERFSHLTIDTGITSRNKAAEIIAEALQNTDNGKSRKRT